MSIASIIHEINTIVPSIIFLVQFHCTLNNKVIIYKMVLDCKQVINGDTKSESEIMSSWHTCSIIDIDIYGNFPSGVRWSDRQIVTWSLWFVSLLCCVWWLLQCRAGSGKWPACHVAQNRRFITRTCWWNMTLARFSSFLQMCPCF